MLIRYKYRNCKGKHGWYQCDCADFKKMWHNKVFRQDLYWCVVELVKDVKYKVYARTDNGKKWYSSKKKWWFD